MTTHSDPRYAIDDRVEFTIDGETIRGNVCGSDAPRQARYAVAGDDGEVRSLWEAALSPSAPAGQPLHEETDRSRDNIPSDRPETNAAALRAGVIEAMSWHEDAEHGRWGAAYAECVLEDYLETVRAPWMRKVAQLGTQKREAEATTARVEAAITHAAETCTCRGNVSCPITKIAAALRGPVPTECCGDYDDNGARPCNGCPETDGA